MKQIHAYRRNAATPVALFGLNYLFAPNEQGHCVADVDDDRAVTRLLQIPEAYRVYDPSTPAVRARAAPAPVAAPVAPPPPAPPAADEGEELDTEVDEVLKGSDVQPASVKIGDDGPEAPLGEIVAEAFLRSGLKTIEWNDNDDDDREALIQGEITRRTIAADEAKKADAEKKATESAVAQPLVLTNGDETVDLTHWSAKQVREFAAANSIDLPKGNSTPVSELRLQLAKGLRGE